MDAAGRRASHARTAASPSGPSAVTKNVPTFPAAAARCVSVSASALEAVAEALPASPAPLSYTAEAPAAAAAKEEEGGAEPRVKKSGGGGGAAEENGAAAKAAGSSGRRPRPPERKVPWVGAGRRGGAPWVGIAGKTLQFSSLLEVCRLSAVAVKSKGGMGKRGMHPRRRTHGGTVSGYPLRASPRIPRTSAADCSVRRTFTEHNTRSE